MSDQYQHRYSGGNNRRRNARQTITPEEYQRRMEFYKKKYAQDQIEREERLKQEKLEKEKLAKDKPGQTTPTDETLSTETTKGTPDKQPTNTQKLFELYEEQRRERKNDGTEKHLSEEETTPPPIMSPLFKAQMLKEGKLEEDKPKEDKLEKGTPTVGKTKVTNQPKDVPTSGTEKKESPKPVTKTDTAGKDLADTTKDTDKTEEKKEEAPRKKDIKLDKSSSEGFINSLTGLPVSDLAEGLKQKTEAGGILKGESEEVKKATEEKHRTPAPTGLSAEDKKKREEKQKKAAKLPTVGKVREVKIQDSPQGKAVKEGHRPQKPGVPESQSPLQVARRFFDKLFSWFGAGSIQATVQKSLHEIPTKDNSVNTSPGTAPTVDLKGKAAPDHQNQQLEQEKSQETGKAHQKAQNEPNKDFGENNIYPEDKKELLNPNFAFNPPPETQLKQLSPESIPVLSAEAEANLNQSMQGQIGGKTDQEKAKITKAKQDKEAGFKKANEEHELNVEKKLAATKTAQTKAQEKAQTEVDSQRAQWKKENDDILKNYEDESGKERQKVDSQVQKKTDETNAEVKRKYREAQQKADAEKRAKEKEAEAKKAEADKKEPSFWDRAVNAVKGFFEGLKKAINFIFDQLRKAVKAIIEGVKKLANGLIELARKAIVGLIKAFGEALKALVTVALAAFPKLAKRINALIDKAVNVAVKVVNTLAEGLKKAVNALLDLLGKALDAVLALYQKMYNLVLDALEFIVVGIVKVMQFIENLIAAASEMPQHLFWSELLKAMVGFDPTAPLPAIERTEKDGENAGDVVKNKALLDKKKLSDEDAIFAPLLNAKDLSPETLQGLQNLEEGNHDFDGAKNPLTVKELKGLNDNVEAKESEIEAKADNNAAASNPDFAHMSDDDKLTYYLDQMRDQMAQPKGKEGKKKDKAAPAQALPDVAKVGPLSVEQRLSFITSQMKIGIEAWWNENKGWVIPTVIGVILGVTALIVVTGGAAIMPVLSALMQGLTVIFGAMLVAQIATPLKDYIVKAWNGDKKGASQSLAQAFAVGLTEIIFNLIFKGLRKLFKLIGKGAKAALKGMKKLAQSTVKLTKRLGTALLRNGKVVFQGLKKGALKGAKSVGGMAQKLARRFRFKRIKIKRIKGKFQIWGQFNPWVLLMNGSIQKVDDDFVRGKTADDLFDYKMGNKVEQGKVLSGDIAISKNWDEWFTNSRREEIIGIFKGKVPDADILELLKKSQPKSLLNKWKKAGKIGAEEIKQVDNLASQFKNERRGFKKIEEALQKGEINPSDAAALKQLLAQEKGLAKTAKDMADDIKLLAWLDEVGLNYAHKVEKANFKNLWKKVEAHPNAHPDHLAEVMRYMKENPQGLVKELKNPKLGIEDLYKKIQQNLRGGFGKNTGSTVAKQMSDGDILRAMGKLDTSQQKALNTLMGGKPFNQLDHAQKKIVRYIFEVPDSGRDYMRIISESKLTAAEMKGIFDKIAPLAANKGVLRSNFRKEVRNLVTKRAGQSKQGLEEIDRVSRHMGNQRTQGELFESWAKTHLKGQQGGRSTDIVVGDKIYRPDNIQIKNKGLEFTEFKHYTHRKTLPAADLAKLKDYAQLIKKGTKLHNGLPLKKAQYIFSDKASFDRFKDLIIRGSRGQVKPYYIDFSNGKAILLSN